MAKFFFQKVIQLPGELVANIFGLARKETPPVDCGESVTIQIGGGCQLLDSQSPDRPIRSEVGAAFRLTRTTQTKTDSIRME